MGALPEEKAPLLEGGAPIRKPEQGVAVLTALGVSAVLALLAVVCLSLVAWRNLAQAREQQALQARWNARAGREHYLATGQLPPELSLDPQDSQQRCRITREANQDLVFEGWSGKVSRKLTLLGGDPARLVEGP